MLSRTGEIYIFSKFTKNWSNFGVEHHNRWTGEAIVTKSLTFTKSLKATLALFPGWCSITGRLSQFGIILFCCRPSVAHAIASSCEQGVIRYRVQQIKIAPELKLDDNCFAVNKLNNGTYNVINKCERQLKCWSDKDRRDSKQSFNITIVATK